MSVLKNMRKERLRRLLLHPPPRAALRDVPVEKGMHDLRRSPLVRQVFTEAPLDDDRRLGPGRQLRVGLLLGRFLVARAVIRFVRFLDPRGQSRKERHRTLRANKCGGAEMCKMCAPVPARCRRPEQDVAILADELVRDLEQLDEIGVRQGRVLAPPPGRS